MRQPDKLMKPHQVDTRDVKAITVTLLLGMFLGAVLTVVGWRFIAPSSTHTVAQPISLPQAVTMRSLLALEPDKLNSVDIGAMNLLCAEGLRGSQNVDMSIAMATLDEWARRVASETERNLHKFRQNPSEYQNAEGYFRVLAMVTVLQQDFRVRYNPERINAPDFSDPNDLFLPGLLGDNRQGTCVSMPVLYVAIGRRLGYPLKLVTSKAHLFSRWESADAKERFNIEATNEGLNCFSDEYYRTWPIPMSDAEVREGRFLESLSPTEELAVFLSARGHCLEAAGRLAEAQLAHAHAHALAPHSAMYLAFLAAAVKKEMPEWQRVQVDLGQGQWQKRTGSR